MGRKCLEIFGTSTWSQDNGTESRLTCLYQCIFTTWQSVMRVRQSCLEVWMILRRTPGPVQCTACGWQCPHWGPWPGRRCVTTGHTWHRSQVTTWSGRECHVTVFSCCQLPALMRHRAPAEQCGGRVTLYCDILEVVWHIMWHVGQHYWHNYINIQLQSNYSQNSNKISLFMLNYLW